VIDRAGIFSIISIVEKRMENDLHKRIYVAGHTGLVGSAIVRALHKRGYTDIVTRSHAELELTDQEQVRDFFANEDIDEVYLAAARVGGIYANNTFPAEFIYQNLVVQTNIIHEAWRNNVRKLLFLGSSCIYPRMAPQPITEASLMQGELEPTNEPYAMAKIAGIKLCESYNRQYGTDYRSVMPTNLYGAGDNYHAQNSHVIPALLRRFHEAKINDEPTVVIWGSGTPRREFLYVDDMAEASVHIMELDSELYQAHTSPMASHINIGTGNDITISELAMLIGKIVGYRGRIEFDASKPDGTPRKWLDVSCLDKLGWRPSVDLERGLIETYFSYCRDSIENTRRAHARALDLESQKRRQAFSYNPISLQQSVGISAAEGMRL
jgi:GDP-L-fucose synthase